MKVRASMTSCLIAGLFTSGLFLRAQTPEPLTQARETLNKGVAAFRNADYESAIAFFRQAVDLDPNFTVAELYLATAYAQKDSFREFKRAKTVVSPTGDRVIQARPRVRIPTTLARC